MPVSSAVFEDPCPGTNKYVEVHYKCMLGWSCTYDKITFVPSVSCRHVPHVSIHSRLSPFCFGNNAIDYFSGPDGNKSSCFRVLETPAVAEHCTAPRTSREGIGPQQGTMHLKGFLLRNVALVSCVCR